MAAFLFFFVILVMVAVVCALMFLYHLARLIANVIWYIINTPCWVRKEVRNRNGS